MNERTFRSMLGKETKMDLFLEKFVDPILDPIKAYTTVPIRTFYYNMKHGIKNIRTFGRVIWRFRPWDHSYMLDVMAKMFTEMVKAHEPGHLVKAPRTAKQLKMAALLCKRLSEQNYYEKEHNKYFDRVTLKFIDLKDDDTGLGLKELTHVYKEPLEAADLDRKHKVLNKLEAKVIKNDLDLLAKLFNKHLLSWWD